MSNRRERTELRKSEWFKRWRVGRFRQEITYLKINKKPSPTHPTFEGYFDFRGANLRMAKLAGAKLCTCCFNEAQMYEAYLVGADMSRSEWVDVDLCHSLISDANLSNSNLTNMRLKSSDLSHSSLQNADLTGADLRFADLTQADFSEANLSLADMSGAKGLDTIKGVPAAVNGTIIDSTTWETIQATTIGKMLQEHGGVLYLEYDYDIAISFAGEDREIAEQITTHLKKMGIRVFYDKYETADLWGKDLYVHLTDIYKNKAKFCLMLLSGNYASKQWTSHERRAAQARAFEENREYILPVRLDDTEIEGILPTVAYLNSKDYSAIEIARLIKQKLTSV